MACIMVTEDSGTVPWVVTVAEDMVLWEDPAVIDNKNTFVKEIVSNARTEKYHKRIPCR